MDYGGLFLYTAKLQLIWICVVTLAGVITLYLRDKLPGDTIGEGITEVFTTFVAIFIAQAGIAILTILFLPFLAAALSSVTDSGGTLVNIAMLLAFLGAYFSATRKQLDFRAAEHTLFFVLSMFLFLLASPLL